MYIYYFDCYRVKGFLADRKPGDLYLVWSNNERGGWLLCNTSSMLGLVSLFRVGEISTKKYNLGGQHSLGMKSERSDKGYMASL